MAVRVWTEAQRIAQSQARRFKKSGLVGNVKETNKGRKHYELVYHLRSSNVFELILAYEALLNGTTLEEWIRRHRINGKVNGSEFYLPPGLYVVALNQDNFDPSPDNLYCFIDRKERLRFHEQFDFPDNEEEVKGLCHEFTNKRRVSKASKERETDN
jgi:hypothetical protein